MRFFLLFVPLLLTAQTPAPTTTTKAKSAAPAATKSATASTKAKASTSATPAAAKAKPTATKAKSAVTSTKGSATATKKKATPPAPSAVRPPLTDEEKTIYSLGLSLYRSLTPFGLSPGEVEFVKQALSDAANGKPAVVLEEWGPRIEPFARERAGRATEKEKAVSAEYLAKAAAEPGAVKTETGLVYRDLQVGTGPSPKATDNVKVHYRGTLVNGTEFDSSYKRNQPAEFPLNGVIRCWTEGLQKMKVGGKARLVCPSSIAYGDQGRPTIPGGAALIFEVELLEIPGGGAAPAGQ